MDGVLARSEIIGAACDADAVFAAQRLRGRLDLHSAGGKDQVVLADNAVARRCVDHKLTGAVDRQILLGEDHGVDVVLVDLLEGAVVGKLAQRAGIQGNEYLVSLGHVDGGKGLGIDGRAAQDKLDLLGVRGVYDHAAIERARENVGARLRDGHGGAVDGNTGACAGGAVARQRDCDRLGFVIFAGKVAV